MVRFEFLPLVVNLMGFGYYAFKWEQPGKILYWLGASLLTMGLLKMKG